MPQELMVIILTKFTETNPDKGTETYLSKWNVDDLEDVYRD